MPDDDLASLSGFETRDSADHGFRKMESRISKKVVEDIQSSVPTIVVDTLKAKLPGLLSEALKNILSKLLQDSIKTFVLKSVAKELRQVDAHVQKNLQAQLPDILLKPM
ncbi:hypothetical protein Tco_0880506 [Tanacetum coccineum]